MVFLMRDIEGYTTSEIAELLEIPAGTVSTRLRAARIKIREKFNIKTPLPRIRTGSQQAGR